jgi:hypothetical protein
MKKKTVSREERLKEAASNKPAKRTLKAQIRKAFLETNREIFKITVQPIFDQFLGNEVKNDGICGNVDGIFDSFIRNFPGVVGWNHAKSYQAQATMVDYSNSGFAFKFTGWKRPGMEDMLGGAATQEPFKPIEPEWRETLKKIPNLKGQFIGGRTILWDHKISFTKKIIPIRSKHGDILNEQTMMQANCSCGWYIEDVLPLVTPVLKDLQGIPIKNTFRGPTPPDYDKLEELVVNHINPRSETEIEYITFPHEWFDNLGQPRLLEKLCRLILNNNGYLHFIFDSREWLLIDDNINDTAIAELKEILDGHPMGVKKVRVIRNA